MIPDRATAYGGRVRPRLTDEMAIWLTTPVPVGIHLTRVRGF